MRIAENILYFERNQLSYIKYSEKSCLLLTLIPFLLNYNGINTLWD